MKKTFAIALLFASSLLNAGNLQDLVGKKIDIVHKDGIFSVIDDTGEYQVQNCFVDKELRNRSHEEVLGYLKADNYLFASRMSDGEYAIHGHGRLPGGGALGATIGSYVGKYGTYAVGHGSIFIASACTGWGFLATFASLESQFAAPIEAASNTAAIAGGLAGGVATGPA